MLLPSGVDAALLGLLGLLVGSFLNVVIHRLPKMMDLRWAAECAEFQAVGAATEGTPIGEPEPTFNLMVPRSRCPHCGHRYSLVREHPCAELPRTQGRLQRLSRADQPALSGGGGGECIAVRLVRLALGAGLGGAGLERFFSSDSRAGLH